MGFFRKEAQVAEAPSSPGGSPSDPEKLYTYEKAGPDGGAIVYTEDLAVPELAHKSERRLVAQIDWRVMPVLTIMYFLAFLDRTNIGNAKIFNMLQDLNMKGDDYNTSLVIFFVPYVLLEIPSNILLKKFKPHVWLSINIFFFGLVTICQGLTDTYGGLLTARFFLGVAETGMFPGAFYLIGMWYKRSEAQKRFSFFFASTTLAGAFGGLLAAAIGKMDGLRGYHGWRWIFILEGTLTCVVGIIFFWLIPDFPEDAKWLTEEERNYVKARLQVDQGKSALDRKITLRDVGNTFKDYKVILGGFMYFGLIVPAYGYAYFAPTIINGYGYSPIQTQLHSVPPWAVSWGFALLIAYLSDRAKHRFLFIVFGIFIGISGFSMLLAIHNHRAAEYAALFLVTMGTYSTMPIIVCWFQMKLGGHHRRAVGSGWQIGFGNVGGIIAVYAYLAKDAPYYTPGYAIGVAFSALALLASVAYFFACWSQNRQRARQPVPVGGETEQAELGDLAQSYRYLL